MGMGGTWWTRRQGLTTLSLHLSLDVAIWSRGNSKDQAKSNMQQERVRAAAFQMVSGFVFCVRIKSEGGVSAVAFLCLLSDSSPGVPASLA